MPTRPTRRDLVDTLDALENAAGVMQFEQVAETLRDLNAFLAAQKLPLDHGARGQAADRIAQVALQARLLSEVAGGDAGAAALTQALAGVLTDDRMRTLVGLAAALGELEAAARDGQPAGPPAGGGRCGRPCPHGAIDPAMPRGDAGGRVAASGRRDFCAASPTGSWCRRRCSPRSCNSPSRRSPSRRKRASISTRAQAGDLAKRIRGALQPDKQPGESEQLESMLAGLKERPAMLDVLSADNVGELATGVSAGANVYELMLYLEDSPALGEAIVAWLSTETKIISNRTVLTGGKSWFDFLILSSQPPEAVREALLLRDPERQCVKSLRQVGGDMLLERRSGGGRRGGAAAPGERRRPPPIRAARRCCACAATSSIAS